MAKNNDRDQTAKVAEAAIATAKVAAETAAAAATVIAKATAASDVTAAVLGADITYIKKDLSDIKISLREMQGEYVTRAEFVPVKNITFGMVTALGLATLAAIFKLIFIP